MLESSLPIPEKVIAVRGFLNDDNITLEMIEKWVRVVYSVKRAPSDMLEFIAIDIRILLALHQGWKTHLCQEMLLLLNKNNRNLSLINHRPG